MGKVTGFIEFGRELPARRPVSERIQDWREVYVPFPEEGLRRQGARCMDCGVPFCHTGCPLNNIIPDWNDHVYRGRWESAIRILHATNNFPEFTGRVCPAPCETACVLGINEPPVTIKQIEKSIADEAFQQGWVEPQVSRTRTGKRIAIVGSGPAGLAAAQQLARAGHEVTVYEKADRIGGLLRYGIPDFKLEKHIVDRRLEQMTAEGVKFVTKAHVGRNVPVEDLRKENHALLLAGGAENPRDLKVPGRGLDGIHFAMDFLRQQNQRNAGDGISEPEAILATGRRVVIIGGGDTGADCLGTTHRHNALSVHQFELFPMPPAERSPLTPWPQWPMQLRVESSHEEGGIREWSVLTTRFTGDENGRVRRLHAIRCGPPPKFEPIPGTEFTLETDLVLLAMGFTGPVLEGMIPQLGVRPDERGNVWVDENWMTSAPGVFATGDMQRGQSLVVWAIAGGRKAAHAIDKYVIGESRQP